MLLVVVFINVKTAGNQGKLQIYCFCPSPEEPFIGSVPLDDPENTFRLDAAVHPQQGAVDGLQVLDHLPMDCRQLPVHPDRPVAGCFRAAFALVRASPAVLTFMDLLCAAVPVRGVFLQPLFLGSLIMQNPLIESTQ